MKISYNIAIQIQQDFQYLVGQKIQTDEGAKEIKDIIILPIKNNNFEMFYSFYLISSDKKNFILPYKDEEMTLIIIFSDDDYINLFQYIMDKNITIDLTKYN